MYEDERREQSNVHPEAVALKIAVAYLGYTWYLRYRVVLAYTLAIRDLE